MNCWKTINISRDYGTLRLIMFSGCTMLFSFLLYYLFISMFVHTTAYMDLGFLPFLTSIAAVIVLHKCLHCIPIWLSGKKANMTWRWIFGFPLMTLKLCSPLSKNIYIISLLMPACVITLISAMGSMMYPSYLPFFSIIASVNFGLCFYDLVYVSYMLKAPKKCYITDHAEGVHILVKQQLF